MRLDKLTPDEVMNAAIKKDANATEYVRVGTDYFKIIHKPDRFGILREELKKWTKDEIKLDHGVKYLDKIPKYDEFIIEPDNMAQTRVKFGCYNMYAPFEHKPRIGKWEWTEILMKHIFGDQYELGLKYLKVLYEHPKQILPVLALVSTERSTGKTTFMDWLNLIFGANMVMIEPDSIGSNFNGEYATANIVGIDETIMDRQSGIEKIKSLATKKHISVNIKNVAHFKLPFFGKIIMASNNEDKFMKIDQQEIRFWVRRVGPYKYENHQIISDLQDEIPAFIYYLRSLPDIDFTKSRMVFTPEEISNDSLNKVKTASKTWLYKELIECFTDYFNDFENEYFVARPKDIKNRFFDRNNQVTLNYIRQTLKTEFNLEPEPHSRYQIGECLNADGFVGTPFKITRELIGVKHLISEELEQPF